MTSWSDEHARVIDEKRLAASKLIEWQRIVASIEMNSANTDACQSLLCALITKTAPPSGGEWHTRTHFLRACLRCVLRECRDGRAECAGRQKNSFKGVHATSSHFDYAKSRV